jgi:methylmalonyl-CoA/ethylmalonyl-CoA epimerase
MPEARSGGQGVAAQLAGLGTVRYHHVGCAVRSIAKALEFYSGVLGLKKITEPIAVPSQKVQVCFVELAPGNLLELVEGLEAGSPVAQLIEKTGGGPYHLCFEVPDLDAAIAALRKSGCFRLNRFELPAHGMRRVAFLLTPDRQLFELCERDGSGPPRKSDRGAA